MTWTCLECGAANPAANPVCGSAACQKRRLTETEAAPQTSAALAEAHKVLKPLEPNPSKQRHTYNDPSFDEFWEAYPSKRGKLAAYRKWKRHVVDAADVDEAAVIAAALRYRNDPKRDPDKTKYAEGWLGDHRWEDDFVAVKPASHVPQATDWDAVRAEEDAHIAALRAEIV